MQSSSVSLLLTWPPSSMTQLVTPSLAFQGSVLTWLCSGGLDLSSVLNLITLIQSCRCRTRLMLIIPKFIDLALIPFNFRYNSSTSSTSPPGHLKGILNLKWSDWVTLKSRLHSPLYLNWPQFHPSRCSDQKPWCHPDSFLFLSYPKILLANVICSTFKIYYNLKYFLYLYCFYPHSSHHHLLEKWFLLPLPLSSLSPPSN